MKNDLTAKFGFLEKLRRGSLKQLRRPLDALSSNQKFWIGFVVLSLIITFLISNPVWRTTAAEYQEGEIARESVISPADITEVDKEETERIRQAARESIKNIFVIQKSRPDEAVQSFRAAWDKMLSSGAKKGGDEGSRPTPEWSGPGGEGLAKVFAARSFGNRELESALSVLRNSADGTIYDDRDRKYLESDVTLVDSRQPTTESSVSAPLSSWIALSQARAGIRPELEKIASLSAKEVDAFSAAFEPLVNPSVAYDSVATLKAKNDLAKSVEPVQINLKRGQTIVREGDTITASVLSQIAAIRNYSSSTRQWNRFIGLLLLITAFLWVAWKFVQHRGYVTRLALSEERTYALFGFVIVIQTFLMAIFFRVADFTAAQNLRAPLNDPTLWALAIPFAFSSLLMTLLADRRTALFTGLFASMLAGLLAPKGLEFTIYSAITSAAAVYGIGQYRSRQSVTTAGVMVGIASALTAVALLAYTQQPFILNTVLLAISCGLASGLVTAAVTAVFLPICENLFGILTDVKLLELSNADLPVLGQLALRAPGTNQHSHAVGQLAEEACRVVGGNGLLARIGALYHDIGKTAAPDHFVENQRGKNPHDRLNAAQSAKIIISHVTYGRKLAKEMGLPARIVDFIPQHHGTRTLHYFLTKARDDAGKGEEIHENEFRYPGPKPQFKESAIMMIADSCEAAARSLSEPNPENIRFIVTKIIDAILADDQLGECDLTLRELTQIRESMIKSLIAIYHSRVDYPGYTPPSKSMQNIVIPKIALEERRGTLYNDPKDIPISKGGEIEDEAIDRSSLSKSKAKDASTE
ncbi:MAG: HDIG domain-containing protein [Acidobacteriota bacterium]|nr:HDIG domain-containing protein [Acidobacteriota bacterium]MDH3528868.1 HDIG domain-containing protein [Acidobacteriota bacterium]